MVLLAAVAVGGGMLLARSQSPLDKGVLILRGELIPGPYTIEIVGDDVLVNGKNIKAPPKKMEAPPPRTERGKQIDALIYEFNGHWIRWSKELPIEEARRRALEFMQAQPLVESARLIGGEELRIRCRGDKGEPWDLGCGLYPPDPTLPDLKEVRRKNLQDEAEVLRLGLSQDLLLIVQGEGWNMVLGPGKQRLQQIEEIVNTNPDVEQRTAKLLRELVTDPEMARAIAQNFKSH